MQRHGGRYSRRFAFPAAALGLLAVITIVGSEVAARVAKQFVCDGRGPAPFVPHSEFGWTHEAGVEFFSYGCLGRRYEYKVPVRINSKGLRDNEHDFARSADRSRVLVLGDSVTEAGQVALEEAFTERLESQLTSAGLPTEVINAGHAAFSTENELLYFRHEGRRYSPDVVMVVVNLANDIAENSTETRDALYAGALHLPKAITTFNSDGTLAFDTRPFRDFKVEVARQRASAGSVAKTLPGLAVART